MNSLGLENSNPPDINLIYVLLTHGAAVKLGWWLWEHLVDRLSRCKWVQKVLECVNSSPCNMTCEESVDLRLWFVAKDIGASVIFRAISFLSGLNSILILSVASFYPHSALCLMLNAVRFTSAPWGASLISISFSIVPVSNVFLLVVNMFAGFFPLRIEFNSHLLQWRFISITLLDT